MKALNMSRASLVALALILTACGGWKQDPLAGKDADFKNGQATPTKPDLAKPLPSDAIRINAPEFAVFEEDVAQEFEISSRVLLENYTVTQVIENMADFPGATFDAKTNKFSWRPRRGFVESVTKGDLTIDKPLNIRATARKANGAVLVSTRSINMRVSRDFTAPTITRVDRERPQMREGEAQFITVLFTDKDADPQNKATWSQLQFVLYPSGKSLMGLLSPYTTDSLGNGAFRAIYRLDLTKVEVTPAIETFGVGISAISRYGKQSTVANISVDVLTSLTPPITTWTDEVTVKSGDTVNYKFVIIDPKQETNLSVDSFSGTPRGAQINCQPGNARGLLNCTLAWMPGDFDVTRYQITANIRQKNIDGRDTQSPVRTIYLRLNVAPKGP